MCLVHRSTTKFTTNEPAIDSLAPSKQYVFVNEQWAPSLDCDNYISTVGQNHTEFGMAVSYNKTRRFVLKIWLSLIY